MVAFLCALANIQEIEAEEIGIEVDAGCLTLVDVEGIEINQVDIEIDLWLALQTLADVEDIKVQKIRIKVESSPLRCTATAFAPAATAATAFATVTRAAAAAAVLAVFSRAFFLADVEDIKIQ